MVLINVSKTKLMIVTHQSHDDAVLYINNQLIERMNRFKYLGFIFNDKWDTDEEVKIRTVIAKTIFIKFHKYLL